jgi:hypothetical protein
MMTWRVQQLHPVTSRDCDARPQYGAPDSISRVNACESSNYIHQPALGVVHMEGHQTVATKKDHVQRPGLMTLHC